MRAYSGDSSEPVGMHKPNSGLTFFIAVATTQGFTFRRHRQMQSCPGMYLTGPMIITSTRTPDGLPWGIKTRTAKTALAEHILHKKYSDLTEMRTEATTVMITSKTSLVLGVWFLLNALSAAMPHPRASAVKLGTPEFEELMQRNRLGISSSAVGSKILKHKEEEEEDDERNLASCPTCYNTAWYVYSCGLFLEEDPTMVKDYYTGYSCMELCCTSDVVSCCRPSPVGIVVSAIILIGIIIGITLCSCCCCKCCPWHDQLTGCCCGRSNNSIGVVSPQTQTSEVPATVDVLPTVTASTVVKTQPDVHPAMENPLPAKHVPVATPVPAENKSRSSNKKPKSQPSKKHAVVVVSHNNGNRERHSADPMGVKEYSPSVMSYEVSAL